MSNHTKDEVERAIAIINEAKSYDIVDDALPETDHQKVQLANYLVKQARKARELGENGDHITRILFTAEVDHKLNEDVVDEDKAFFESALSQELESGIPIPPEIEGEPPLLPHDLTEISLSSLVYLHGAFNACSARAGWLYAYEEAAATAAAAVADHYEEEYIISADRKDLGGKPKPQVLLKAEAKKRYPKIKEYRDIQKISEIKANKYKRLLETYNNSCERLSRQFTMRQTEKEEK
jgi:hypothetical protein